MKTVANAVATRSTDRDPMLLVVSNISVISSSSTLASLDLSFGTDFLV